MDRPKVVVYNIASVDGRIAVSRDALLLHSDDRWTAIEGQGELDVFAWLKHVHKPQATLEGSGSFVRDDEIPESLPSYEGDPRTLYQDYLPDAVVRRPGHRGWFTAVDGRGRVRWLYKEYPDEAWAGWHLLVLVGRHTPPEYLAYLRRENIPYLVAGEGQVDLCMALAKMKALLGVMCLLSTAGGRLNGALVRAGVVDEVNIQLNPGIIGGVYTPSLFDSPDLEPGQLPVRLSLVSVQAETGGRVWLRYTVAGPRLSCALTMNQ